MSEFAEWESFYVIVGGGAAALIGLQFVVMTLIAEKPPRGAAQASAAFSTPTIVHFSAVLLLSAILRAPWHSVTGAAILWCLLGLSGLTYSLIVVRRMRRQNAYKPEFEDWLFHGLLPLAAYGVLAVSAVAAKSHTHESMFAVGSAALLLLFTGIHNAWDAVAYYVHVVMPRVDAERK
jgi:hypothetical protein